MERQRLQTLKVRIGENLTIGGDSPIVVQTMCNTHTSDVEATVEQCLELASAGAQMIRITVPGMQDVPAVEKIRKTLDEKGCRVPLVADIHFSSQTAFAVAPLVEKVRINPGNFHPDHETARRKFAEFLEICRQNGTAVRVGLNHGSLGRYITDKFGNTPFAMATAAMEWLQMCIDAEFFNVVVSLKASNTVVMVQAYRELVRMMKESGHVFPLHLGVTEAGNGDSGRIKSCVGIATLLEEGIGDTIRVSLTEPPVDEIPVARYLADRYSGIGQNSALPVDEDMLAAACKWGPALLNRDIDEIPVDAGLSEYLADEIMQAARRRFYRPEYVACPGCGRTMYDLQATFEEVKRRTSHLKGMVIAVMGCIVNGPGEMADADWGYVGEGGGRVSIYKAGKCILQHIPDKDAIDRLLELIRMDGFMQSAIEEAREGISRGHGGPFGSVIVKDGRIIGRGHNRVLRNNDPTCHGEVAAIRDATSRLGTFDLSGCEIYTTGEPCHMCLCACMWANISKIYYGCTIEDNGRIGFRDDKFDGIFGGREKLDGYLVEFDRDDCLKLFDDYLSEEHKLY